MNERDHARDMVTLKAMEANVAATALRSYPDAEDDERLNVVVLTDAEAKALLPGVFPEAATLEGFTDVLHNAVGKIMETQRQ